MPRTARLHIFCFSMSNKCSTSVQENWLQTSWGSVCRKKTILFVRIKLSDGHRLHSSNSSQRAILWNSYLIFDLTQLLAVEETLLCDYPVVVDYILAINLTKHMKRLKNGFIHSWWSDQNWFWIDKMQGLSSCGVSNDKKRPISSCSRQL